MEFINLDTGEPREVEVNEDEVRERLHEAGLEVREGTPVDSLRKLFQWLRDL